MKTISKSQLLTKLTEMNERHLSHAVEKFQNFSTEQLLRPAKNGGWSIAQCLDHLNRYGLYYLPKIAMAVKTTKGNPSADQFTSSWIGSWFTRMMDPDTGKKKIKAFKEYIPPADLDTHAVVAEFIEQQERLQCYLRKAAEVDLQATRIPISISKWIKLNLGDVLQFVIAHNERHMRQAIRNE